MISTNFIRDYLNMVTSEKTKIQSECIESFKWFLDAAIEASNMAVIALDMQQRVVIINGLACSIFNISANNMIDRRIKDVLPESPLTDMTASNFKSIPRKFQINETTLYAERTLISHANTPIALISFFQDITTSEITTQRLNQAHKQEAFFNELLENSYDGIYITDRNGQTLMVNKAYERITGLSRDILVGEYMSKLVSSGLLSTSLTEEVVSGKETVTRTQQNKNGREVIITGSPIFDEHGNVRNVITNVRDITELVNLNTKLEAESIRANMYQEQLLMASSDENIVYGSHEFESVLNIADKVSRMDSTVLILGETGVGKEIVAQYIHKYSKRSNKPYIKINCGAIPANLLESELFGYVPGAFTGASNKGKPGLFELADTGTLFLDEIGELPLNLQASLLRVLQDGEVTRVGGSKAKKVDVRIIAATNRNLEAMMSTGTFRSDLYYRLNVISVNIPPLRERRTDIPPLAEKTIQELNQKYNTNKILTTSFIQFLMEQEWPGNIRELKNFIEKQFVLSDSNIIDTASQTIPTPMADAPQDVQNTDAESKAPEMQKDMPLPTYAEAKLKMEKDLFRRAMTKANSTYKAAALLDMSQPTFFRKYKMLFPDGLD